MLASLVKADNLPSVSSYDLRIQLLPCDEQLQAVCSITLHNRSNEPVRRIPVLLYRLLEVTAVQDQSGQPMHFEQHITRMADNQTCQVNALVITSPQPLAAGDSLTIQIDYQGYIYGYPEVMQYTKDRVSEEYTLIRDDVFAYPVVADTSWQSLRQTFGRDFTYMARVKVPRGYMVASGGALIGVDTTGDSVTFAYRSKVPVSRIDLAAAHFGLRSDSLSRLSAFYLPADSDGARYVLQAMRDVVPYYTQRFGPAPGYAGFTVIEIPDGWGSQAGRFYILQTAAAFKDSTRVSEVYHEVGHSWNARPDLSVQRCRYFDEAFASYFESISLGHFQGDSAMRKDMEASRKWYVTRIEKDSLGRVIPIAQYGEHEIGGYSYTKGAWSLYVLNRLIGDAAFDRLTRAMLQEYTDKPIDFQRFKKLAERVLKRKLDKFFDEWIFGTASTELLVSGQTIDEMVARYK